MLRKLTALMFILVMTLLITLKHPVLGYCFCLDTYFTGDCVCQVDKKAAPEVTSCCSNCSPTLASEESKQQEDPCDDCTKHLNVDVADFVWKNSDRAPSDTPSAFDFQIVYTNFEVQTPKFDFHTPMPIRGDPPPGINAIGVPLYLRHSVLRL